MVFGLGGPSLDGCSAVVTLAKSDYNPGEVVQGEFTLSVTTPVECLEFTLALVGLETLTWQISSGDDEDKTIELYDVKNEITRQEISLLQPDQTVIPTGQHVYPVNFSLPVKLPGTQETIPTGASNWERLQSHILYGIEVKIHQKGAKEAKRVNKAFVVNAVPPPRSMYPGKAVSDSKETRVMYFCCFNKGNCKVTLSVDRDAIDINTGVVPLVATIANETSMKIDSLVVSVHQDLLVHIPTGEHKGTFTATPQLIHTKSISETIAPHTTKEGIQLPVSMAEYSAAFRSRVPNTTLVPSCDVMFASVRFRVAVEVNFDGTFADMVEADLPIVLLNFSEPPTNPVSEAPPAVPKATPAVTPTIPATIAVPAEPEAGGVDATEKPSLTEAPHTQVSSAEPVTRDEPPALQRVV